MLWLVVLFPLLGAVLNGLILRKAPKVVSHLVAGVASGLGGRFFDEESGIVSAGPATKGGADLSPFLESRGRFFPGGHCPTARAIAQSSSACCRPMPAHQSHGQSHSDDRLHRSLLRAPRPCRTG